jgi:hypothetical protein
VRLSQPCSSARRLLPGTAFRNNGYPTNSLAVGTSHNDRARVLKGQNVFKVAFDRASSKNGAIRLSQDLKVATANLQTLHDTVVVAPAREEDRITALDSIRGTFVPWG